MDNVISIFTGQEPCKYMNVERDMFIKSYLGDVLHSFNCNDCKARYQHHMRTSANLTAQAIMNTGLIQIDPSILEE